MNSHKYILEPYHGMHTRHICPSCEHSKTFVRYVDTETGKYLSETVGRCNREGSCGYHYTPKQFFADHPDHNFFDKEYTPVPRQTPKPKKAPKKPSFIDADTFKSSLTGYKCNSFVHFLIGLIGLKAANELISKYYVGSSSHWRSSTIFWQVDINGRIRTGKIMGYNPDNGKRIKKPFDQITWVHSALKLPDFNLSQCFFGEHLLIDTSKVVAIVESEKTAILASFFMPQYIWIAAGNKQGLNESKFKVLKNRDVILFPDLGAKETWTKAAGKMKNIVASISISNYLEKIATEKERNQGLDLADYIIKSNLKN